MASTIRRSSYLRGRPSPCRSNCGGLNKGSSFAHCLSVKSLGYMLSSYIKQPTQHILFRIPRLVLKQVLSAGSIHTARMVEPAAKQPAASEASTLPTIFLLSYRVRNRIGIQCDRTIVRQRSALKCGAGIQRDGCKRHNGTRESRARSKGC